MSDSSEPPVELPWRVEQAAVDAGRTLPQQDPGDRKWGGLAFGVGDLSLVTELTSIIDVLECPAITPLPGTHSWLRGICNVRGRLFSVVDLGLFLGVAARVVTARAGRILVVNNDELDCTLLVPRVYGLRYFTAGPVFQDKFGFDEAIRSYIDRAYVQDDRVWPVLSLERMIADERFLNVNRAA